MSIPAPDIPIPPRVRTLAPAADLVPVWINGYGGVTFRATDADGIRFIKYDARNPEWSADDEAERLRWAEPYTPVPHVLETGRDATREWIVTTGMLGESAAVARGSGDGGAGDRGGSACAARRAPGGGMSVSVGCARAPRERGSARHPCS